MNAIALVLATLAISQTCPPGSTYCPQGVSYYYPAQPQYVVQPQAQQVISPPPPIPASNPATAQQVTPSPQSPTTAAPTPAVKPVGQAPTQPTGALPPELAGVAFGKMHEPPPEGAFQASGPKAQAFAEAIQGGEPGRFEAELEDDSKLPFVTVISTDRPLRVATIERLAPVTTHAHVNNYAPSDSLVKDLGYYQGSDVILVQSNTGQVTGRLPIDASNELVASCLRKADPTYQPSADPTGKPADFFAQLTPMHWIAMGAVALLLLRANGQSRTVVMPNPQPSGASYVRP
jgi:hypothetical protein